MPERYFIGVDLGGTNIKTGLVTQEGKVLLKASIPSEVEGGPDHVMSRVCGAIEEIRRRSGPDRDRIAGLGIGSPGTLDIKGGIVRYPPNLPGWSNVPVVDMVEKGTGLRAILENDANAAAYGEFWVGCGSNVHSMVMLTLGTGIGGGIIIEDRLLHGDNDCAGEVGHMIVVANGRPCPCGNWGCLEAYASANSLARRFAEAVEAGEPSTLAAAVREGRAVTSVEIAAAAEAGDELSRRIYLETAEYLGMGIVNVMHMLNPELVVLSGGLIGAGEMLMGPVRETVEKRALPDSRRRCGIVFAALGEDAGFIGGAGCASVAFGISR